MFKKLASKLWDKDKDEFTVLGVVTLLVGSVILSVLIAPFISAWAGYPIWYAH